MTLGLRGRILAVVAAATLVPTILVGALAVRRARRDVESEVVRGNLALVRALGAGLDGTLQDVRRTLTLAAAAWADGVADGGTAEGFTRRILARVKREMPMVARVAVFDPEAARRGGDPIQVPIERQNTYGGYIADACAGPGRGPDPGGGCQGVVVVVQARARTGELFGYIVADLDLAFVEQALALARLGRGARLWVVDSHGTPVSPAPRAGDPARPSRAAVERALASADEGSLEVSGVLAVYRNLASFQTTRGVGWAIVLEQPTREAYALALAQRRDTLLAGAAVLLLALLAASVVASRLARPLRRLAAHVDAFAAEQGDAGPLPVGAPGEIGALARRFGEMERRVAERARLQAELARGAQLASVGALAAGVAHEINNPLTTILGYANLLLEDKPEGHADREALALVADEARRVQGIVRTLLDHARVETGPARREPLEVNVLCERTAALLAPTLKKRRVTLALDLGDAAALPRPAGDPRRLEQVFVNLGQNAAQAMEAGGSLTIRTRAAARGGVAVEFQDTGPGIPPEVLGQIFEPFFTTKGPGVGTGLGLAISHQIALDHGGRIEVESEVGRGSTFRVILGESEPAEHVEEAEEAEA